MRRVLVVARWYPAYDDPGRGAFVADHVRALVEAGVAVTVASFEPTFARGKPDSRPERIRVALDAWSIAVARPDATNVPRSWGVPGVPVARLPVVLDPADRSPLTEVSAHAAVLVPFGTALAARDGVDIIHAHTAIPDGLAGAHLADALGIPLVVTEHDSTLRARLDDPDVAALYATLPGPRRRLVAVSDRLAALLGVRVGIPRDATAVIPNAIPFEVFTVATARDEGRDPDELLYVGGRTDAKGMDVLLHAFAAVRERRPALHLRCVGRAPTPEDDERWRKLSADLGVAGAVELGPPAERRGVADAMRHAGLLVLASPYETFGMVVAEALACGLPVAATRSGVEAILGEDGTFGEVATGTDAATLADAIDRALARLGAFDPATLRERVLRDFSGPAIGDRTLALYAEVEAEDPAEGGATAMPPRVPPRAATGPATPDRREASAMPVAGTTPSTDAATEAGPRVRPLLVAFNRTVALRSVPRLPAAVAERAVVVTVPPTPQAQGPVPAIGTWIEYDPVAEYKARLSELTTASDAGAFTRLRAATTAAARHRERDDLVRDREAWIEDASRRTFHRARDAATATDHVGLAWVAVEADDVTAGRALSDAGVALAPGTLRWLADREDSAPIASAPGADTLIATTPTVEETR